MERIHLFPKVDLEKERWVSLYHPDVQDCCEISNYGRIRHILTKRVKKTHRRNNYRAVGLYRRNRKAGDPKSITLSLHVLVCEHFVSCKLDQSMQVNHIDTNKCNNMASNLEHLTGSDNQKHAVATGLQPSGEDRLNSLFTNEFVEEVCELMEKGLRTKDIIYLYKDKYDKKSLKYLISDIRRKRGWMFISNKYDIVKDTYRLMLDRIRLMIDNNMGFDDIYNILINEMGYSMVQRSLRDIMRYIKKRGSTTIESTLDMGESE